MFKEEKNVHVISVNMVFEPVTRMDGQLPKTPWRWFYSLFWVAPGAAHCCTDFMYILVLTVTLGSMHFYTPYGYHV